ncbi:MAG: glycoside hydrolase family 13 protein [Clostridia bacterium]|nr:glycoside hydrolase family 13 protein [Clostridia bacterium]
MLPRLHEKIEKNCCPLVTRWVDGREVFGRGAFAFGTALTLSVRLSRRLGVSAVVLRIALDGDVDKDIPFTLSSSFLGEDQYTLTLDLNAALCGGEDALLYYEILFLRGAETLFTNSVNNVDFTLSERSANRFRLLVYRADYHTPKWFFGGTMYHVFVDRFCRGDGEIPSRDDAILNEDWESGIPQYPEKPGDEFANNEFFGGNLWGVEQKLDYFASLGVTVLYLSPVFKAYSNHKYDTGDYSHVDEMFGGDKALVSLIEHARQKGIRIILDGVFNHTGDDSLYFNRYGKYDSLGAYQSKDSPYFDWYHFKDYPDSYECWWGIRILPKLDQGCKACREYFVGEGGIVDRYLALGIGGWRLDVADELSDEFLDDLRTTAKKRSKDAIIIGEVWENAADKMAYGKRRRYFRGGQLDSVMNYPVRNAILAFVLEQDGNAFYNTLTELYSSYPSFVCDSLMNLLGTHDTARILSVLGDAPLESMSNRELATYRLDKTRRERAICLLKLASTLQFTVFGVPSVYYGDEAGLEGGRDPFCRMPYPWGREDAELVAHYRFLGKLRKEHAVFQSGAMTFLAHRHGFVAYARENESERILILANSGECEETVPLSALYADLASGKYYIESVTVSPRSAMVLKETGGRYAEKADRKIDKK